MYDPLKALVEKAIHEEPSPTRAQMRTRNRAILVIGLFAALSLFLGLGGFRSWGAPRPLVLIAATFAGTLAISLTALRVAYWRSGGALGPSRSALLWVALAVPPLIFAWKVGWSAQFSGATDLWPSRLGLRCFGVSSAVGAPILAALLATRRRSDPVHPRAAGVALGVTAGAIAALLVDLWCPVGHPGHVLLGHVAPIVVFGALGAWPGSRLLDLK